MDFQWIFKVFLSILSIFFILCMLLQAILVHFLTLYMNCNYFLEVSLKLEFENYYITEIIFLKNCLNFSPTTKKYHKYS